MNRLTSQDLKDIILKMREEGLFANSINSYTRTLKIFFFWCNDAGHTRLNIKLYKAPETVQEVYTDEEPPILLKKPESNCNFCEYRNWVLGHHQFLAQQRLSSCHSAKHSDSGVNLARKQIVLRHTNAITKVLYPQVDKTFGTMSRRVERAIRHAIKVAWDRRDLDILQKFFGYTVSNTKGKLPIRNSSP